MYDLRGYHSDDEEGINGIAGWLAFFAVSIIVSALLALLNIITNYVPVLQNNTLSLMYNGNRTFFYIMLFEIISGTLLFGALVYLCIVFFKKSKKFPNLMIWYMIGNCILVFVDFILYMNYIRPVLNLQPPNFITPAIYCIAWGIYLKKSRRVSNTFVN